MSGLTALTNARLISWRKRQAADAQGQTEYSDEQITSLPRIIASQPGYKHIKAAEREGFAVSAVLIVEISLDINAGDRVMSDHPDVLNKALIVRSRSTIDVPGLRGRELLCEWEVAA